MKTCPLNKVVTTDGALALRLASWCGIHTRWLKPLIVPLAVRLDDWLGKGRRNPVKKWWFDLEVVDGICVEPIKGTNARDLNLDHRIDPAEQKMAYYQAHAMPVPNDLRPQPLDRKAGLAEKLETPAEAAKRTTIFSAYIATSPRSDRPIGEDVKPAVYGSGSTKQS